MRSAGAVFALASAGAAMTAAAADAMFLAELGPGHLGEAVAVSSALLAVVLAIVGGLSDRLERRRVLASLSVISAIVLAALAALSLAMPKAAAVITLVAGKQLTAATDLSFWVVIAERLDARRSRRMLPVLAATGGAGAALGAVLVIPLAEARGARGVLLAAAVLLVLAAIGTSRITATRRVAPPVASLRVVIARSWRDGARAVMRQPLARQLAVVVAIAGAFASLAYFALGVAVAGEGGTAADFAALLGGVRGVGQLVTLGVQLVLAPRLLARLGTGHALVLAPLVALAAGTGLVLAPILAVAIAAQISTRVLDAGIETPAEKLAQTLVPAAVRGRIAGFLDGTAKRAGAVLGGVVAAALAGAPGVVYAVTLGAAAVWLGAAWRLARALPALAVAHVARAGADADTAVDSRAVDVLARELAGPDRVRAAELLARLHERGRVDAVTPLARAAATAPASARGSASAAADRAVWRALVVVLDRPAEAHGADLLAAATVQPDPELAVRALGLAGGVSADALAPWRSVTDGALGLTVELAALRLGADLTHTSGLNETTDAHPVLVRLAEAVRDGGAVARAAIEELTIEIARGLAMGAEAHVLAAARSLVRALRRGRGDVASRAAAFTALARVVAGVSERRSAELALLRADLLELARERVDAGASAVAPPTALTSLLRPTGPVATGAMSSLGDDAAEIAAALALCGALLAHADTVEPDDLRRLGLALGEPDDEVSAAAETALAALGPAAAGELVATAAWGRRRARDRAAALLAELPVTPATLDRLIEHELDALDRTQVAIAGLAGAATAELDALLVRRLDERLREIAHTVLLLVAARRRSPAIARAASAWRGARGSYERARTLAVVETALPRALVTRLVDAVDELGPADRAAVLTAAGVEVPARDDVVRGELAGRDRLARALAVHALGAAGRGAHRRAIADAARSEALAASPAALLRRVAGAMEGSIPDDGGAEMPSRVESLITLGRVPLFATLTTRQLADLAERARWFAVRAGEVLVTAGDPLDALVVVEDGELALGDRRIGNGEVVDELACVAPQLLSHDLRAVRASRAIRLERADFEELVDDVPGLAATICRALGERARRAEDRGYRSPLATAS